MMRFIRSLFGRRIQAPKHKSRRPAAGRRLGLEGLESRDLMALGVSLVSQQLVTQPLQTVAPSAVTIGIQNHDLVIRGTDGPDDVKVAYKDGKYVVTVTTEVNGRAVSQSTTWRPSGGDVFFYGNKGDDKFLATFSAVGYLRVTADGGDGNDNLTGSLGKDNLKGGNGRDTLIGQANADFLDGGFGPDYLDGGDGNDDIWCGNDYEANNAFGGAGNDTITGSYGSDALYGGGGNDSIDGSLGNDSLLGDAGNDTLAAGIDSAANYLDGGTGHDTLYGSFGDDWLIGNAGNDYLYGSQGNDRLDGNAGNDWLYGEAGNDILNGGSGFDHLYGGDDDDKLNGGGDDNTKDMLYGEAGRDKFNPERGFKDSPIIAEYDPPAALDGSGEVKDFEFGIDELDFTI